MPSAARRLDTPTFGTQSFPLLCNKSIHRHDRSLRRKNLLRENAVNFRIGIETRILEDDAPEVQVKRPPQRGKSNPTRRNSKKHQILNATRAKNQVELVLRKRADSLLMHY